MFVSFFSVDVRYVMRHHFYTFLAILVSNSLDTQKSTDFPLCFCSFWFICNDFSFCFFFHALFLLFLEFFDSTFTNSEWLWKFKMARANEKKSRTSEYAIVVLFLIFEVFHLFFFFLQSRKNDTLLKRQFGENNSIRNEHCTYISSNNHKITIFTIETFSVRADTEIGATETEYWNSFCFYCRL